MCIFVIKQTDETVETDETEIVLVGIFVPQTLLGDLNINNIQISYYPSKTYIKNHVPKHQREIFDPNTQNY